jgi:FtsH-binding integral membrane protein
MAFDRVFPEIFTRLNKQGSPVFTHIFDLVLTLGFLAAPIISTSGATALYGAIVIGMVYFFVVSIAGIVHGLREMKILVPISGFSAAYFIFLTYEAVSNPTFEFLTSSGSVNPITLAFVIGTFVVGGIIYAVASYLNKKKGIDITLVYKEIPPD